MPSELNPIWGNVVKNTPGCATALSAPEEPSERVLFLAIVVMIVAAIGFLANEKEQTGAFVGVIAVLMWLLSLGPILQVAGKSQFTVFKVTVPLPYLVLFKLPLISIMRTPRAPDSAGHAGAGGAGVVRVGKSASGAE